MKHYWAVGLFQSPTGQILICWKPDIWALRLRLAPNEPSRVVCYPGVGYIPIPVCLSFFSLLHVIFSLLSSLSLSLQLLKLETVLYSSRPDSANPKPLQDNFRTTQPLNNRTVLSSFTPGKNSKGIETDGKRCNGKIQSSLGSCSKEKWDWECVGKSKSAHNFLKQNINNINK